MQFLIEISKEIFRVCNCKGIKLLKIYKSEVKKFPFPRSEKAVKSLAEYRGSQSGFLAAEAFQLLKSKY